MFIGYLDVPFWEPLFVSSVQFQVVGLFLTDAFPLYCAY